MGYLVSLLVGPKSNQMCAVVIALISAMLGGSKPTLPDMQSQFTPTFASLL